MGWGDALGSAWDAATGAAQAAANAVGQAAQATYDFVANEAQNVYNSVTNVVNQVVDTVSGIVEGVIGTIIGWVVSGFQAVWNFFSGLIGGGTQQPCPGNGPGGGSGGGGPGGGGPGGGGPGGGGTPGTGPGGGGETPPPVDDHTIVSIEWLNGDDATVIGDCEQFVNLPRDAKWLADSDIPNIDRLGIRPRFLVKFDKPVSAGFQWRLVPVDGGTPAYTGTEEGRNPNFKASPVQTATDEGWQSASVTDGKVVMTDKARLVAGGGYKFKLEAKDDKDKHVFSGVITTKRLFWYVELPMTGLANALTSTASVESEFATYHMVLKQLPDLAIPLQENIGNNTDSNTLATNVENAINGNATAKAKSPYILRITYTDHLAVKNPNQRQRLTGAQVGPGKPAVTIGVTAAGLRPPNTVAARSLWNDLVTGEGWFVSASYTPDGGGPAVAIPADKVTAPGTGSSLRTLSVDVTGLPAGTGTIDVFVNVVDRMRAGLAVGGAANICVCTIAWWTAQSQTEQAGVVIHEAGHKVHQVADGTGNLPDRVATQYDNAGHVGSHCHNGAPAGEADYGTSANEAASTCVMFGSTNGHNSFCGNCGPAVTKVDIGSGF